MGPPDGRGPDAGGLDVLSLGQGGSIVLGFGSSLIVDDDGADFIVFENPFWVGGDSTNVFAELGLVEVSEDGQTWIAFPCDLDTRQGCAGWRPPLIFAPEDTLPPSLEICGGDGFDLAEVGLSSARFIRITDLGECNQPQRRLRSRRRCHHSSFHIELISAPSPARSRPEVVATSAT